MQECPYCVALTRQERAASRGIVLAALEAADRVDVDLYKAACDGATAADFHSAVDMICELLNVLVDRAGLDAPATVKAWRAYVNGIQAER